MQAFTEQELIVSKIFMESIGMMIYTDDFSYCLQEKSDGVYAGYDGMNSPFVLKVQCHHSGYILTCFYENLDGLYEFWEMGFDFGTELVMMCQYVWEFIIDCVKGE